MEAQYMGPLDDAHISAIFADCDDFLRRELWQDGQTVYAYAIDGLVDSGDISEFLLKPLSQGMLSGSPEERLRQALAGRLWGAAAERVGDLEATAGKLVNGFCVLLFPGAGAAAFEVKTSVKRGPSPPEAVSYTHLLWRSPNFLPVMSSSLAMYSMISAWISRLIWRPSS